MIKRIGVLLAVVLAIAVLSFNPAFAAPTSVTIAGDLQTELGCPGDWQPDCATTHLTFDAADDVWQGSFSVPAGNFHYKAALDNSWNENYGANAQPGGSNIPLNLVTQSSVKFYYDDKTHWITDYLTSVIATVPGSFQNEIGCPGDWDPGCLRSWLQDIDGDGIYTFVTAAISAGSYECKVAINENWNENYGAEGAPGGANISFAVFAPGAPVSFSYDSSTHVLTVIVNPLVLLGSYRGGFQTIADAYADVMDGESIKMQANMFAEDLYLNLPVNVNFDSGWNPDFTLRTGETSVRSLTIINGSAVFQNGTFVAGS